MSKIYSSWSEVPKGMCLVRVFHERLGMYILHAHLKLNEEAPWYSQPRIPIHSQNVPGYEDFWKWTEQNLPIWDYPEVVKGRA